MRLEWTVMPDQNDRNIWLETLSTAKVAEALGVGVSTVKRWVDDGILPARKTPGGHRKLLLVDVLRLGREGKFPTLNWSRLEGLGKRSPTDPARLRALLHKALQDGDGRATAELLLQAWRSGLPLAVLGDDVINPVMKEIGHAWETGAWEVYQEHRATFLCSAGLIQLRRLLEQRGSSSPMALVAAPEGDPYVLPGLLLELVLLDAGWRVAQLGPNTPLASLSQAVLDHRPRLVCLTASHLADSEAFLDEYRKFFTLADGKGVSVAVGGQALQAAVRERMLYHAFGDNLAHLLVHANGLHPRRSRPRRGRPRGGA